MPDHQHVGGSKNSNINVKRDNISKPKKSKGEKNRHRFIKILMEKTLNRQNRWAAI